MKSYRVESYCELTDNIMARSKPRCMDVALALPLRWTAISAYEKASGIGAAPSAMPASEAEAWEATAGSSHQIRSISTGIAALSPLRTPGSSPQPIWARTVSKYGIAEGSELSEALGSQCRMTRRQ